MRRRGIDHSPIASPFDLTHEAPIIASPLYWEARDWWGKNGRTDRRSRHDRMRRRARMDDQTTKNRGRMTARRKSRAGRQTQTARVPAGGSHHAASIGRVARRIRDEPGLTLPTVAQQAHISPGMLSRLETGRVSPSLETIVALAEVLGIRPALLLQDVGDEEGDAQHVPDGQGLEVVRRGTKRGHTYHLLAAQRGPRKSFEPFLVTLTDKSEVFPGFQHPGTEFLYLLAASLTS